MTLITVKHEAHAPTTAHFAIRVVIVLAVQLAPVIMLAVRVENGFVTLLRTGTGTDYQMRSVRI